MATRTFPFLILALSVIAVSASAAPVAFTGGADDEIAINVGTATGHYFRLKTDDDHLKLKAEGPLILALRLRALTGEQASGVVRILRDEGPYSDNPYKLAKDAKAVPDVAAQIASGAVTVEKMIYIHVGEGLHRYSISALKGPPIALRLFKVGKADPKFDALPEKNTAAEADAPAPPIKEKPAAVSETRPPAPVPTPAPPAPPPPAPKVVETKPAPAPPPPPAPKVVETKPAPAPPPPAPAPKPAEAKPAPAPTPPARTAPKPIEAKPAVPSPAPPAKPATPDAGSDNPFGDLPPIE